VLTVVCSGEILLQQDLKASECGVWDFALVFDFKQVLSSRLKV
jgi:hypothetical protein